MVLSSSRENFLIPIGSGQLLKTHSWFWCVFIWGFKEGEVSVVCMTNEESFHIFLPINGIWSLFRSRLYHSNEGPAFSNWKCRTYDAARVDFRKTLGDRTLNRDLPNTQTGRLTALKKAMDLMKNGALKSGRAINVIWWSQTPDIFELSPSDYPLNTNLDFDPENGRN